MSAGGLREWVRTPQCLFIARSTDWLHGKRNRAVWGEGRQKQLHTMGWTNGSRLSAGILIRFFFWLLTLIELKCECKILGRMLSYFWGKTLFFFSSFLFLSAEKPPAQDQASPLAGELGTPSAENDHSHYLKLIEQTSVNACVPQRTSSAMLFSD